MTQIRTADRGEPAVLPFTASTEADAGRRAMAIAANGRAALPRARSCVRVAGAGPSRSPVRITPPRGNTAWSSPLQPTSARSGPFMPALLAIGPMDDLGQAPAADRNPLAGLSAAGDGATRLLDLVIALIAIVFTAPLLLAVALAIKLSDGGTALFGHRRIGRGGKTFDCLKFRSMVIDADQRLARVLANDPEARAEWARDHKLRNDPRVTPLGEFLRRSSLDELPQLFNVLRGEMSIVGPRPIVAGETPRYGHRLAAYCSVRPGITGLWQVSGRNDTSYRRRVAMDTLYAHRKSLALDIGILFQTVPAVLFARGSY